MRLMLIVEDLIALVVILAKLALLTVIVQVLFVMLTTSVVSCKLS